MILSLRGRETRSSFRKAVDKTYDGKHDDVVSDEADNGREQFTLLTVPITAYHTELGPFDRSVMSYTKNPKNKVKRKGFLKNLFR